MTYKGFIGPAYRSRSIAASGDRLVNLFPEQIESDNGKNGWVLYGTPGISEFCDLSSIGHPVRAQWAENGRCFVVVGAYLVEVFTDGTYTSRGSVTNPLPSQPAQIVANGYQLLVKSGTAGFIFDLNTNTLTHLSGWLDGVGASAIAMINNYFLASKKNSRQVFISSLNDGLVWDALDFFTKEGGGDNIVTIRELNRQLWVEGSATSEVWYNSGSENIFDYVQGAFIQMGCAAAESLRNVDNSLMWVAQNEGGAATVVRADGYTAKRMSNHALEYAMQSYSTVSDAIGFRYQEQGHEFYNLSFPTANATWTYDAATQQWHERSFWDSVHAEALAQRQRYHCYTFGKHLVGDYATGQLYEQSMTYLSDDGAEIRRIRQAPVIAAEMQRIGFSQLALDLQQGADVPNSPAQGYDPTFILRVSNDGGYTWSSEIEAKAGRLGQYGFRTIWRRLGSGLSRVFEVSCSEPIPHCWINAYLEMSK